MHSLAKLPNIGAKLQQSLEEAGIQTPEELRELGAKEAFFRLRMRDPTACFSRLCALQGAVEGIRWHNLPEASKAELRAFYKGLG